MLKDFAIFLDRFTQKARIIMLCLILTPFLSFLKFFFKLFDSKIELKRLSRQIRLEALNNMLFQ